MVVIVGGPAQRRHELRIEQRFVVEGFRDWLERGILD